MYTYEIEIGGTGSESVCGTIPKKVAGYWQMKYENHQYEHLKEYLDEFGGKEDFLNEHHVPKMYEIEQYAWHDIDDIQHSNGVYMNGNAEITITDKNTLKEVYFGGLYDIFDDVKVKSTDWIKKTDVPKNMSVFYAWTTEKMWCVFDELRTRTPFDINKLRFNCDMFRGDYILNNLTYNGRDIDHNGGEGFTKCLDMDITYFGKTNYPS